MLTTNVTQTPEPRKGSTVTFSIDGIHTLTGEVIADPQRRMALVKFIDRWGILCVAPMGFGVLKVVAS